MNLDQLNQLAESHRQKKANLKRNLGVCVGTGCTSAGSLQVLDTLRASIKEKGLGAEVGVQPVGCRGACSKGPLVRLSPDDVIYQRVDGAVGKSIVEKHLLGGQVVHEAVIFSDQDEKPCDLSADHPFFKKQHKIVLENCGSTDPESIEDYVAADGYRALQAAVTRMLREDVIAEVKQSGLRGRGGAGYPTGLKWEMVYKYVNDQKYVICNGDEGDPGAFMDRSVMEGDPHRILEGMAIAGYAVGAQRGYVYVRAEYPLAIKRLELAIKQAKRLGVLGKNIFESEFNFDVEIRIGAGAFVCGEETALIASIEGKRGQPRPRPPYPAECGLWGKPTLINNVETFANIAPILRNGGEWFSGIGTPKSKGTKVFALTGKVKNNGLIEVPMGITLREVIFDIGGGIPGGKKFKAAQTGGPSGGCIPEQHLDTPLDYESLVGLGSIMGSGGLIVMDETSCMVDVARFFMEFCMDESCGKCVPCRVGTKHMHNLLTRIVSGVGQRHDLELLEELAPMVRETSLCGLGMTAPNPLLSTLRYFRHEYNEHIEKHRCPAGVCSMKPSGELVGLEI